MLKQMNNNLPAQKSKRGKRDSLFLLILLFIDYVCQMNDSGFSFSSLLMVVNVISAHKFSFWIHLVV